MILNFRLLESDYYNNIIIVVITGPNPGALLVTPWADGLFQRAIIESGSCIGTSTSRGNVTKVGHNPL